MEKTQSLQLEEEGCKPRIFDLKFSFLLTIITPSLDGLETHLLCRPCHAWCSDEEAAPPWGGSIRPLSVQARFPITGVLLQYQLTSPVSEFQNCPSLSSLSADILETSFSTCFPITAAITLNHYF